MTSSMTSSMTSEESPGDEAYTMAPNVSLRGPYHLANCITGFIIILSNGFNICAILCSGRLRSRPTCAYVISLSCADLLMGQFLVVLYLADLRLDESYRPLGTYLRANLAYSLCLSLGSHLLIAMDRYIAVVRPLSYKQSVVSRRPRQLVALIWFLLFVVTVCPIIYIGAHCELKLCLTSFTSETVSWWVYALFVTTPSALVLFTTCSLYVVTYIRFRKRQRQRRLLAFRSLTHNATPEEEALYISLKHTDVTSRRTKKVTLMMVTVLAVLLLCWLPQMICNMLVPTLDGQPDWYVNMFMCFSALLFFNSFVNTLIYAALGPDMRQAYLILLRRACPIRQSQVAPSNAHTTNTHSSTV